MKSLFGSKHLKAFRDNYLAAFGVAILTACTFASSAQVFPTPSTNYAGRDQRREIDSALFFVTSCGVPTDSTYLFSFGFGAAKVPKMAAIYYDSCGHHGYFWDPALKAWHRADTVGSGGGGTGSADSLKHLFVDTGAIAHNAYYLGFDSVNRKWKLYAVSFYDSTIMQTKYRSDTGRINFYAALSAKLSAVATSNSVTGNGTGPSPVQLVGDVSSGTSLYYGFNGSGARGMFSLPAGAAPNNPTAQIGVTPINGTASTFMRSDAAPSLDTAGANIHTDGFNLSKYKRIADSSTASGYVTHTALNDSLQNNADTTDYREIGATGVHPFYLTLNPHHTILAIPKMRGLAPIKVAANGTDSVTEVSADTSSANTALATLGQLQKRIDSLGGVTNTALAGKVANNGASTGIKAGTYASRPAASNCQCYYWSTDSAWYSYDNGSWKDLKPGSGGSSGGSTVVDTFQVVTSGSAVTVNNGVNVLIIDPSSPLSSLAITLPATPSARNYLDIVIGRAITVGNTVVSSLSLITNTGQTMTRSSSVGLVSSGDEAIRIRYYPTNLNWYNEQ